MAVDIELPAVVDTPQPTVFVAAKKHASLALGTAGIDNAHLALRIAKGHLRSSLQFGV